MFRFQRRPADTSIEKYLKRDDKTTNKWKADVRIVIGRTRSRFSVFKYINLPQTKVRLNKIVKDVYVQFKFAEDVYNRGHPGENVQIANYWLEWIKDYFEKVISEFKKNMKENVSMVKELLKDLRIKEIYAREMRDMMDMFQEMADDAHEIQIDTSGFPAFDSPITEPEDIEDDEDTEMRGT